jgi:hypothetical protein
MQRKTIVWDSDDEINSDGNDSSSEAFVCMVHYLLLIFLVIAILSTIAYACADLQSGTSPIKIIYQFLVFSIRFIQIIIFS